MADQVADQLAELGEPVAPLPWCQWAWRAWHALTDERQWRGGGMGPATPCNIPWTAIRGYADTAHHPLPLLFRLLRAMDGVYADWWSEQVAEAQRKQEAG